MEGLSIIEGKELKALLNRLTAIEQNQLALMKLIQNLAPQPKSEVPDFISVEQAMKAYGVSKPTIYNHIKLFESKENRPIDRLWSGGKHLINAHEMLMAMRLRAPVPEVINKPQDL